MSSRDDDDSHNNDDPSSTSYYGAGAAPPPTYAAFSPVTLSANTPSRSARRSTILVHQKSPLLLATPPQITRALAYSHPFILPLNTFAGLLTWSSGDPWKSFLLLCAFWVVVLYGDVLVRWAGPVVVALGLMAGMYGRRYSPLSSSPWSEQPVRELGSAVSRVVGGAPPTRTSPSLSSSPTADGSAATPATPANTAGAPSNTSSQNSTSANESKHARNNSEATATRHQKTLDEIVETLKELTGRCNVLMDPLLEMTDFLSTQRTATSATTKPALTAMFVRLLIVTPFWVALAAPPWRIVTTRRIVLIAGTLILTWHARAMRVTRAILWRSATVRRLSSAITGLHFETPTASIAGKGIGTGKTGLPELAAAGHGRRTYDKSRSAGVKFTFIIYENQRRWVGLGWTMSLFTYERPAWSDEHNNEMPPKDEFELPEVEDGSKMRWRWADGSRWRVDGVSDDHVPIDYDSQDARNGWIYYDNQWQNGRRGVDGWNRWTRRRKWYRDAELVEVEEEDDDDHSSTPKTSSVSTTALGNGTAEESAPISPTCPEPALPPVDERTAKSDSRPTSSDSATSRAPSVAPSASAGGGADDTASIHSTSSRRSWNVFRSSSSALRRKVAGDRPSADGAGSTSSRANANQNQSQHARRKSDVLSEEDDDHLSGLGIEVEMELQKRGKEGDWGIGDEARMNLE
ncbi:Integral peroxisomal membrane peroxin [Geosmithia morbida]|uniref:Integral peroxisomal membrane peroxin n=1 Tax=Geosmithia morbida TaxID=1094350 RepID=A0A9P5D1I6_9HYPO|nr:Integral peroxisomal membrane peroxin [Geosmithia morbida]KAF4122792.1 Integral peroxisomal membrane peroxin [Geosmithia morbida]